ncbi:MAG: SlyX protein [Gammaproteobacteria bacterium]|nr:MAG: SlyX protein [Gammaproteobacteria bacterium]RLA60332.1 MAG: SlyX protein [Gammaproteobacteria bacterium]
MKREINELKQQVMEVQSQLAFQEDTVHALDAALALQQQEILLLRRQLELIKLRQDEQAAGHQPDQRGGPVDEKPPHY